MIRSFDRHGTGTDERPLPDERLPPAVGLLLDLQAGGGPQAPSVGPHPVRGLLHEVDQGVRGMSQFLTFTVIMGVVMVVMAIIDRRDR